MHLPGGTLKGYSFAPFFFNVFFLIPPTRQTQSVKRDTGVLRREAPENPHAADQEIQATSVSVCVSQCLGEMAYVHALVILIQSVWGGE